MTEQYLNRQQSRDIDRRAVERLNISSLVLMENAGRGCADLICRIGIAGPVMIVCGKGNNAGDGFVIARQLDGRGFDVRVWSVGQADALSGDAAANYQILRKAGIEVPVFSNLDDPRFERDVQSSDWIVDALLGTGATGDPREPMDRVIDRLNAATGKKLAVDVPSGLDCETGEPSRHTFRADHTCTFVAMKTGFAAPRAAEFLGELHVLGIGLPHGDFR